MSIRNRIRLGLVGVCIVMMVAILLNRMDKPENTIPVSQDRGIEVVLPTQTPDLANQYQNVYIIKAQNDDLSFYSQGKAHEMKLAKSIETPIEGVIADLECQASHITKIVLKPEIMKDKVLAVKTEGVETKQYGMLPFTEDCQFYQRIEETTVNQYAVTQGALDCILPGSENVEWIVAEGKVCAAILQPVAEVKQIRVLLNTTGFASRFHEGVELSSQGGLRITSSKGEQRDVAAGEHIKWDNTDVWLQEGPIHVQAKDSGKIALHTILRNGKEPSYRGAMELRRTDKGIVIINELPLEEYLYAVVPSEMPVSYGAEALKAQAVCARSYAMRQMTKRDSTLGELGAHLEDSVSSQVYHNSDECPESIQAVDATKNQVLKYKDEIAVTYYYSTSCGYTTGAKEVWMTKSKVPYLVGKWQGDGENAWNLKEEKQFRKFLSDENNTYDHTFPWYRWQVTFSKEQLNQAVDENLAKRYQANPALILTKNTKGKYESIPITSVGKIKRIVAEKRETGGIVTSLVIIGSKRTVRILSEYNIRSVMSPIHCTIKRNDSSKIKGQKMLPSAFFVIDTDGSKVKFRGGGYGHGVGMSQNGAKTLAASGKSYDQILGHYYPETSIGNIT